LENQGSWHIIPKQATAPCHPGGQEVYHDLSPAPELHNTVYDEHECTQDRKTAIQMTEYVLILVSTVLVNNFVLTKFLGLCPFMGVSRKLETATGMALATTFVLTLSSVCSYLVNHYLLVPLNLEYLRTISFILVIAAVVQFTEMVIHKTSPLLYQVLGIFLPLITTNCAVLGVALLNVQQDFGFLQSAVYGFGASVGFSMVLILFAAMRERITAADVPVAFRGPPIALITAGLMSMAFMGFSGLVKG